MLTQPVANHPAHAQSRWRPTAVDDAGVLEHASWVNQVELFFSILQRKVIRNGNFADRDDLIDKLIRFIADYDQTARPFAWTYAGQPLKVA